MAIKRMYDGKPRDQIDRPRSETEAKVESQPVAQTQPKSKILTLEEWAEREGYLSPRVWKDFYVTYVAEQQAIQVENEMESETEVADHPVMVKPSPNAAPILQPQTKAEVKHLHKPIKVSITSWYDADVIAWLKCQGPGYQTRMNNLLRACMESA